MWGDMAYYIPAVWKKLGGHVPRVPHLNRAHENTIQYNDTTYESKIS